MARVIGQPVVGWKLGATSPAMRRQAGHDGPIIGRIFESVAYQSPANVPAVRFPDARVECEFAFRLTRDVPPQSAPFTAENFAGIVDLHPAIEIIGSRYPVGHNPTTTEDVADNGAGIGFVFGSAATGWQELDLQKLVIDVRVDDRPPADNFSR